MRLALPSSLLSMHLRRLRRQGISEARLSVPEARAADRRRKAAAPWAPRAPRPAAARVAVARLRRRRVRASSAPSCCVISSSWLDSAPICVSIASILGGEAGGIADALACIAGGAFLRQRHVRPRLHQRFERGDHGLKIGDLLLEPADSVGRRRSGCAGAGACPSAGGACCGTACGGTSCWASTGVAAKRDRSSAPANTLAKRDRLRSINIEEVTGLRALSELRIESRGL